MGWALFFVGRARRSRGVDTEAEVAASVEIADVAAAKVIPHKTVQSGTPRGDFSSRQPVQAPGCGRTRFTRGCSQLWEKIG